MFRLHLDLIPSMICQLYILENNRKLIKDSNGMEIRNFKDLKTHIFFFVNIKYILCTVNLCCDLYSDYFSLNEKCISVQAVQKTNMELTPNIKR